ncbi:MAG: DUF5622 domain-containing protein [Desulfurococcaceae archaeon]
MGLKHKKYIYVKRSDGWYVKVRVLNIRFGSKIEQADVGDPSRYVVIGLKTRNPPQKAITVGEEALPEELRNQLYTI